MSLVGIAAPPMMGAASGAIGFDRTLLAADGVSRTPVGLVNHPGNGRNANNYALAA
jgi:hypothetical protein